MRATWAFAIALVVLLVPLDVGAQGARPFRIYAITFRGMTDVEKGFEDYFRARQIPVEITFRDLARDSSRMPGFLAEIRKVKPDLIYTWGTSVTLGVVGRHDKADPQHIRDIPVVFTMVAAPVAAKIVPDLQSSNRNVTGVFNVAPIEAQFRAMNAYRAGKTFGVVYTPTEQNSVVLVEEIRALAKAQEFAVIEKPFALDSAGKVTNAGAADMVRELRQKGADWLYLPPDSYLNTQTRDVIIPAAMQAGLPTFASTEGLMETGALLGLVARYHSIGQFTAYKAEQVLVRKMQPGKIPVETLTRYSLQIRMEAAKQLGLLPPLPMFNYAEIIASPVKVAQ